MTGTICRGRGKGYCPLQQKSVGTAGTAGYLRPFPHRGGTSQLDHENDVVRQYRGLIAAHGPVHVLVVNFGGIPWKTCLLWICPLNSGIAPFILTWPRRFSWSGEFRAVSTGHASTERSGLHRTHGRTVEKYGGRGGTGYAVANSGELSVDAWALEL